MEKIICCFIFLIPLFVCGQLANFCEGGKGDPIFLETFGNNSIPVNRNAIGTTTYNFVNNGQPDDGDYTISSRFNWFQSWFTTTDRTPGDTGGRALIVNADDNTSGQFFERNIEGLCSNTTYEFSTWLLNLNSLPLSNFCTNATGIPGGIPINVRIEIWDEADTVILASGDTGDIFASSEANWQKYGLTFSAVPGQERVILRILNNGVGGCGNDLALDDIQFVTCGDLTEILTSTNMQSPLSFCDESSGQVELRVNTLLRVFSNRFYQWEESLDGIAFTSIVGANNETFKTENLIDPGNYFYRIRIAETTDNLLNNSCSTVSDVFEIQINTRVGAPSVSENFQFCAGDDLILNASTQNSNENIRWYDQAIGGELLFEGLQYRVGEASSGNFQFFVEAFDQQFDCPSLRTEINVTVFNEFENLQNEVRSICPSQSTTLVASLSTSTYAWSTGETTQQIEVSLPGIYTVEIVNDDGCVGVEQFAINLFTSSATIEQIQTIQEDISVTITGQILDYEYSIDGVNFQSSPIFRGIETGNYTIFIRDVFSCGVFDQKNFFHLNIPKHFSPNNDGFRDEFVLNEVKNASIFTRYGKLILQSTNGIRWDGTYNGETLPSDTYWYLIETEAVTVKGQVLLKR